MCIKIGANNGSEKKNYLKQYTLRKFVFIILCLPSLSVSCNYAG